MATLFVLGMQMVIQGGIDYRKGLIAGVAFWAGVGFQYGAIFPSSRTTSPAACCGAGSRRAVLSPSC